MIRLPGTIENNNDYGQIFQDRARKEVNWQDLRRWRTLLRYWKGFKLIDLGCLDSLVPIMASELNKKQGEQLAIWGVDSAQEALYQMYKLHPEVHWAAGDVYNLKQPSDYFDYAVLGEVLEHLEEPEKAVKEAFRILRPGGVLAISVPLEEAKEVGAVDLARHLWSFDKQDLRFLVGRYGNRIKFDILHSSWFPYRYCWPQLICWVWKK